MMNRVRYLSIAGLVASFVSPFIGASVRPEKIKLSDLSKTDSYIRDGLVVGGDQAVTYVNVKDIRHALNSNFERVVIDVDGLVGGAKSAIPRAPFFQVAVNSDEKRLHVTVFGSPKLGFDPGKVTRAFKKSRWVAGVDLLPKLEEGSWTFSIRLKSGEASPAVEVFELKNPVRIIVDMKGRN
jgi:hypothetical protein